MHSVYEVQNAILHVCVCVRARVCVCVCVCVHKPINYFSAGVPPLPTYSNIVIIKCGLYIHEFI